MPACRHVSTAAFTSRTRRVGHADEADEDEIPLERDRRRPPAAHRARGTRGRARACRPGPARSWAFLIRARHAALKGWGRSSAHTADVTAEERLDRALRERDVAAGGEQRALAPQRLEPAGRRQRRRRHLVHGRHPLAVGIERRLGHAREEQVEIRLPQVEPGRGHDQRAFRRIAERVEVARLVGLRRQHGVVAQRAAGQQEGERGMVVRHASPGPARGPRRARTGAAPR